MAALQEKVTAEFQKRFGAEPTFVVRAPGRVNLIGEHTDYNDGFVLPMAIDRAVWAALRPRDDGRVLVHSLDFAQDAEIDALPESKVAPIWAQYVQGVLWSLRKNAYHPTGWEGVIAGDVPVGAGLSSSAALELAAARAFASVTPFTWDAPKMALISQRAENEWVGVNCGIMDQMISAAGEAGHALLIDCRSLATEAVPLPPDTSVVILDTMSRRGLVSSAYNERRQQCENAARIFGVKALRDVSVPIFKVRAHELDEITRKRARHIVTENERTLQAAQAMRSGDAVLLGQLMNASHESLRDDFEVTNAALNAIVQCAQQQAAMCYGARMTGAGFGGCAVALVKAEQAKAFADAVTACYEAVSGIMPNIYICSASQGAQVVVGESW
ncbi:MAG: galactokinase [Chloroflexi bacterium]|nr:galactokinase [Chloroflexota bacterium]